MPVEQSIVHNIEAILFDVNGTLRVRESHEPTQHAAFTRMLELLGKENVSDVDWDELTRCQKGYGDWAQENLLQLSEAEIWTRWMLPDYPREQIEPLAAELMLAWSNRKGRTVPIPGAEETLIELRRRGYRLGVISNTMSSLDIPRSLEAFGWKDYFEAVILSSVVKSRKPAHKPFLEAARLLNVEAAHCAYLGNRISRDIVGCKGAGFSLGMIIEPFGKPRADEWDQSIKPDIVINSLTELLNIFPVRSCAGDQNRKTK